MTASDDELESSGCDEPVDVRRPIGVEVTIVQEPSMTSHKPARATIVVGRVIVHQCDEHDLYAEGVARWVGELLQSGGRVKLKPRGACVEHPATR